jgi:hypothetical protein
LFRVDDMVFEWYAGFPVKASAAVFEEQAA